MIKNCEVCGKPFEAARNKKTCSEECTRENRKRYRQKWLEKHPDYMQNYFREHRERYTRTARQERKSLEE